jgi:hypothetical protein
VGSQAGDELTARETKSRSKFCVSVKGTQPAIPEGLQVEELSRNTPGSAPAARAEEGGWLKLAVPQSFSTHSRCGSTRWRGSKYGKSPLLTLMGQAASNAGWNQRTSTLDSLYAHRDAWDPKESSMLGPGALCRQGPQSWPQDLKTFCGQLGGPRRETQRFF